MLSLQIELTAFFLHSNILFAITVVSTWLSFVCDALEAQLCDYMWPEKGAANKIGGTVAPQIVPLAIARSYDRRYNT